MPAPCDAAPTRAFGHSFPNRKPQKEHIAHRHPKDARHHHKQRHQVRLSAEGFAAASANGVVTDARPGCAEFHRAAQTSQTGYRPQP